MPSESLENICVTDSHCRKHSHPDLRGALHQTIQSQRRRQTQLLLICPGANAAAFAETTFAPIGGLPALPNLVPTLNDSGFAATFSKTA